jgi:hypothetical protein
LEALMVAPGCITCWSIGLDSRSYVDICGYIWGYWGVKAGKQELLHLLKAGEINKHVKCLFRKWAVQLGSWWETCSACRAKWRSWRWYPPIQVPGQSTE